MLTTYNSRVAGKLIRIAPNICQRTQISNFNEIGRLVYAVRSDRQKDTDRQTD